MEKRHILFLFAAVILCCLCGCAVKTKDGNEKIKDIEFTVLGEDNIPGELKEIMEQKKEKEFKMTYQDGDFLYICVGYGRQETGGYSITVNDLYLTGNSIYVDTNLIGPEPENRELYGAQERDGASYPYVVLKIEYMDKSVVFD
ncbi:MAG: protease complex subunit PrcB family protein [Kineothrix sp.]|mgnify:FL=1|nr:hypothetical protein C807_03113 [Lachnospiraceae bacterium 28-4]MCX4343151.1 protease complex subunit PrcB family protein [Kineothrix sp.]